MSNEHQRAQVDPSLTQRVLSAQAAEEQIVLNTSSKPLLGSRQAPPAVAFPGDKPMTICRVLETLLCPRSPHLSAACPTSIVTSCKYVQYRAGSGTSAFQKEHKQQQTGSNLCLPSCGPQTCRG